MWQLVLVIVCSTACSHASDSFTQYGWFSIERYLLDLDHTFLLNTESPRGLLGNKQGGQQAIAVPPVAVPPAVVPPVAGQLASIILFLIKKLMFKFSFLFLSRSSFYSTSIRLAKKNSHNFIHLIIFNFIHKVPPVAVAPVNVPPTAGLLQNIFL